MKTREEALQKAKEMAKQGQTSKSANQHYVFGAMDMFDWLSQDDGWIPVSERLPEIGNHVNVCGDFRFGVTTAWLDDLRCFHEMSGMRLTGVQFWQPLPVPPEGEQP